MDRERSHMEPRSSYNFLLQTGDHSSIDQEEPTVYSLGIAVVKNDLICAIVGYYFLNITYG